MLSLFSAGFIVSNNIRIDELTLHIHIKIFCLDMAYPRDMSGCTITNALPAAVCNSRSLDLQGCCSRLIIRIAHETEALNDLAPFNTVHWAY